MIVKHGIDRFGRAVSKKDIVRERSYLYHRKKDETPKRSRLSVNKSMMKSRTNNAPMTPYRKNFRTALKEIWNDDDNVSDDERMSQTQEFLNKYWASKDRVPHDSEDDEVAAKCQKMLNDYYTDNEEDDDDDDDNE